MAAAAGLASAAALLWRAKRRERRSGRAAASVTVDRPREEVFSFWRTSVALPRLVEPIEMEPMGDDRLLWRTPGPGSGAALSGTLQVVESGEGGRLTWRSPTGSDPMIRCDIRLEDGPRGATTVHATLEASGIAAAAALDLLDPLPASPLKEVLRNHKRLLETGEIPTTEGQPAGAGRGEG